MNKTIRGSCLCGGIKFEISEVFDAGYDAAGGALLASGVWNDRRLTRILSSNGAQVVISSESNTEPPTTYIDHLTLRP